MGCDGDVTEDRSADHSIWVAGRSDLDLSADRNATYEERGRATDADGQRDVEGRGSKTRVRSFDEEDYVRHQAPSHSETRVSREKGKEKIALDQAHTPAENEESLPDQANDHERGEHDAESEANDENSEDGDEEHATPKSEKDTYIQKRKKRKDKRRVRSFLNQEDDRIKDEFFFCDHPFLLDPTTKARIVHIDAAMQMSYEVEVEQAFTLVPACYLISHTRSQDAIAKLSFLGMLKEQSLPLFVPASVQRTAVPHLILEIRRYDLISDTLAQVRYSCTDLCVP